MFVKAIQGDGIILTEINKFHLVNIIACLQDLNHGLESLAAKNRASDIIKRAIQDQHRIPRNNFDFMVTRESDGLCIGGCSLRVSRNVLCEADLGYYTHSQVRNLGLASSAAKALVTFAFDSLKVFRLSARVQTGNQASIRVLQKLGFTVAEKVLDELVFTKIRRRSEFLEHQSITQAPHRNFSLPRP